LKMEIAGRLDEVIIKLARANSMQTPCKLPTYCVAILCMIRW
jgi:hypothetical protein